MRIRFALATALALGFWPGSAAYAQNSKANLPKVETYYGLWRDPDGRPIFFERKGIDDPSSNKYVTGKTLVKGQKDAREWVGFYDEGKVYLSYRPTAEEMNAKLPLWVREEAFKQVLRWRLEVSAVAACGAEDTIIVKWFPGELEWEESAEKPQSVRIVGEGKPIEIKYRRDLAIEVEFTSAPSIRLYTKDGGRVDSPDVKYVTTHESFRLEVLLPRAQAEKHGEEIPVEFTGKLSGRSMKVMLKRTTAERTAAVRYTQADPIRVDSLERILAFRPGQFRGEIVTLTFGDVSAQMRVFANAEARALFRMYEALGEHEAVWLTHLNSPSLTKEEKEFAQQHLRLVRNAKILADGDAYYDYRVAMVGQYLSADGTSGLILRDRLTWIHDAQVGHNAKIELMSGNIWDLGFGWAAEEERVAVTGAYAVASAIKANELTKATIFAVYDFVATQSRADKIVMLLFGVDHRGKRVDTVDRIGAIGRFFVPDPSNPLDWLAFARSSTNFASAARRLGQATRAIDNLGRAQPGALPPGVPARVRKTEPVTAAPAEAGGCLGTLGPSNPSLTQAHENYPESFKLLPGGEMSRHGQIEERGCLLASFAHEHAERRGVELDQHGLRKYLELNRIEKHKGYGGLAVDRGIDWTEGSALAHATGAVAVAAHLTPYEIEYFLRSEGWSVFLSMAPKKGIRHAVVLKTIVRDSVTNEIKRIEFFDPDVINPLNGRKGHIVFTDNPCDFFDTVAKENNAWLVKWDSPK